MCESERHTLAEEERKVCEICDRDVSASSTSDAHSSIEVKDELRKNAGQYHPLINDRRELTLLSLSRLKRAAEVGASSNWAKIAAA